MKLVLHGLKKGMGDLCILVVINAALLIDVGDLEIEPSFTGPYLANAFQQFVEIVFAKALALLQSLVVQHKAFDDELPQGPGGPDAELGGLVAIDPVANGNDGIKVVEGCKVVFPVIGSYSDFSNNCIFL